MRSLLFINLIFLVCNAQARMTLSECSYDSSQTDQYIDRFISSLQEEKETNNRKIEHGWEKCENLPSCTKALEIENKRGAECNVDSLFQSIMGSFDAYCQLETIEPSCNTLDRKEEIRGVLNMADRAIYGAGKALGNVDKSAGVCEGLTTARARLVEIRQALYSTRTNVDESLTQVKNGNANCSNSTESNLLSENCLRSLTLDHPVQQSKYEAIWRKTRVDCTESDMARLKGLLSMEIQNKSNFICKEIVQPHLGAVALERELENKRAQIDHFINSSDQSIVEINKAIARLSDAQSCIKKVAGN